MGIQYSNNGSNIDFIQTEEGRYEYSGGKYQYDLKDHLGNVRVMIDKNTISSSTPVQENEYYAFGLNVNRTNVSPNNKYLYNGKELQEELTTYDYGWRQYDPVIGRWGVPDPLAESYESISPYAYVLNNPAAAIDIDGLWTQTASGWSSDNAQEAQDFFKALQVANNNGGTTEYLNGTGEDNEAFRMISSGGKKNLAQIFYNSDGRKAKPMDGPPEITTPNTNNPTNTNNKEHLALMMRAKV